MSDGFDLTDFSGGITPGMKAPTSPVTTRTPEAPTRSAVPNRPSQNRVAEAEAEIAKKPKDAALENGTWSPNIELRPGGQYKAPRTADELSKKGQEALKKTEWVDNPAWDKSDYEE